MDKFNYAVIVTDEINKVTRRVSFANTKGDAEAMCTLEGLVLTDKQWNSLLNDPTCTGFAMHERDEDGNILLVEIRFSEHGFIAGASL